MNSSLSDEELQSTFMFLCFLLSRYSRILIRNVNRCLCVVVRNLQRLSSNVLQLTTTRILTILERRMTRKYVFNIFYANHLFDSHIVLSF